MKSRPVALLQGILFFFCGAIVPVAEAKTAGNCLECHSQKFSFGESADFYGSAGIENRLVYQARLSPCPGVKTLSEETFHTESRLAQLNRLAAEANGEGTATAAWRRKTAEIGDSFARMKAENSFSTRSFARGAAALRGGLQKIYDQAFGARAESGRRWLVGVFGILLILAAVLAGIGHRKLGRFGKMVLTAALICGSFSLSACSQEAKDAPSKSASQERLDQAREVAAKLTAKVESQFAASILLAGAARETARFDGPGSDRVFQLAWRMALKARDEGGQIAALKKIAAEWPNPMEAVKRKVNFDAVLDLRDDLKSIEGRTWGLRAVAEEWAQANPKQGREALEFATRETKGIQSADVRDIEFKAMAEAWAEIDETMALETLGGIQDPFLKSVALAGIACRLKNKEKGGELFSEAWKLMETIPAGPLKMQAWAKISAAAARYFPQQKKGWKEKAQGKTTELKDPLMRGFALQELVSAWADSDWEQAGRFAGEIPADQAEARAFALIRIGAGANIPPDRAAGLLRKAIDEAERIQDAFLAQRAITLALLKMPAQSLIEARKYFQRIKDPLLRSEVETRLIEDLAKKDLDEALNASAHIPGEFQRSRAILTVLNKKISRDIGIASPLLQEARKAGVNISDPYTQVLFLVDLGRSWGRIDKGRETAIYEDALKACKEISSPSLKAEALEALAAAWKGADKARAQAALDSIDPGVLRARETVAEVKLWAKTDLGKARQASESIPGSFPIEKAQAFKELGSAVKKTQSPLGIEFFEKAWKSAVAIPEGGAKEKILTQIITETAPLNTEKSISMIQAVSDREIRDRLLKEAGIALFKEETSSSLSGALKIAKEISESTLRAAVYQKAADRLAGGPIKGNGTDQALVAGLSQWGKARESAKKEETEAKPVFEKAFADIGKIADARERALLLAAMIGDWAQVDEGAALKAAVTIPPETAEPRSYGLLQAGIQFRKWSRQQPEGVFEKALNAAEGIPEPSLRGQRMIQIAKEWQLSNRERGKEILRRGADVPGSNYRRAKTGVDWYNLFYKESIEKDLKTLEKTLSLAQETKNPRLLTEVALVWSGVDSGKAQEIVAQIEPREYKAKALRGLARQIARNNPALAASLLEKAGQEAMAVEGLGERISALRGVAADWSELDSARAKAVYQMIFQTAERADSISSGFANR